MNVHHADDRELVAAYRDRHDQSAFTELVRRHRERVFRLACSILGRGFEGDAEEVTQEVFLRVHHGIAMFREEAKFSSWIYRITFNQAVNLKSRVRYRAPHLGEEALQNARSTGADPHDALAESRCKQAIEKCIAELPEVYQSSLHLYYWMNTPVIEIADLIGVPENTVKSYLHRARRLLGEMLKERGFEDV
jgi:RNA polymerase sigma-70 factor (ECF subfamily)